MLFISNHTIWWSSVEFNVKMQMNLNNNNNSSNNNRLHHAVGLFGIGKRLAEWLCKKSELKVIAYV